MGAGNIKNHIRATSESLRVDESSQPCFLQIGPLPLFLSVSPRKHPSIKLPTQQQTTLYLKTTPKKIWREKKLVSEVGKGKKKKLRLEVHIYIFMYIYILIFILWPTSSPLSTYFILKSNFISPTSRQATKNRQSTGREARKKTKTTKQASNREGDDLKK